MNHKSTIEFGIIGMGRFGSALAKTLLEAGRDVLVIDNNESNMKQIRNLTENAFILEEFDKDSLEETGIQNCETVIVCISSKIEASILTTLNLINMGVPKVIAKAGSYEQGCVLEKIGAEVVYPEKDMGVRLGNRLMYSNLLDFIQLRDDITISKLKATEKISGHTISDLNIRQKFGLNIIAIERKNTTVVEVTPDCIIEENEFIVVIGSKKNIHKFERFLI